jgi:peptidoglycan L-alanyl-D-glutamate endopeptidase CwlK
VANTLGIKIRWGGDWNGDLQFRDEKFKDLPHFELVEEKP